MNTFSTPKLFSGTAFEENVGQSMIRNYVISVSARSLLIVGEVLAGFYGEALWGLLFYMGILHMN